jgi:hypothetical protein
MSICSRTRLTIILWKKGKKENSPCKLLILLDFQIFREFSVLAPWKIHFGLDKPKTLVVTSAHGRGGGQENLEMLRREMILRAPPVVPALTGFTLHP